MAIQGLQEINIGLPNESTGSDSLFTAFNKTKDNFTNLFANASPTPLAGNGIAISNVSNVITVSANLVAGNNTILTNSSGAIIIESLGGSENLTASAAANLLVTASYFTTSTAETATLAAGTEGQIKTFMMKATSGNMVITVTNAGWKTSGTGTITFANIGDACTLQYISSKWFCIGNNGAVFA